MSKSNHKVQSSKMKKIYSFIVGLACCSSVAAQQTYTLDQLKQLAVENNYNLRSARNAIQQSKEQKSEAFTKYFPTVSAVGAGITMNKYLLEADLSLPDGLASQLPPAVSACVAHQYRLYEEWRVRLCQCYSAGIHGRTDYQWQQAGKGWCRGE